MAREVQGELVFRTWGGRRPGAGRPPTAGRRMVPHRPRAPHDPRTPVHVTMRAMAGLRSLRGAGVFEAVRRALAAASHARFRLLQFSVQADHLHLLVEADRPDGLTRGCQGLAVRLAKAINRVLRRRGQVWGDRYHARWLRTPREVHRALVYVLQNFRKHIAGARGLDPRSSAAWFAGWRTAQPRPVEPVPVSAPRTWLARTGWLRHGRLDPDEGPRRAPTPRTMARGCRCRRSR
jgi:putative transposase